MLNACHPRFSPSASRRKRISHSLFFSQSLRSRMMGEILLASMLLTPVRCVAYQRLRTAVGVGPSGTAVQVFHSCYFHLLRCGILISHFLPLEHAKQNWKSHKSVCKSLKGASWITLPFNPKNSTQSTQSMVTLNHRAVFQGPRAAKPSIRQDTDTTPNPYGSQPFLLKLQLPISSPEAIMLIYDQTRAIQLNIFRANTPLDVWSKIEDVCQAEGALKGLKLYVWARRKSDMEFSIAIDRLPDQQTIPW